jgi:N-acetylmuramoyl-L-alanine amidase CwlA
MVWRNDFIRVNGYARSGKKLTDVRKLVIHYTANPGASAANHQKYFNNLKDRYASAHIFIDKDEAVCIIPLNEVAYHANDVQKRNANGTPWRGVKELLPNANYLSIGVEMCLEKDGSFHPDTISRTEDVFVELCKRYNLDPIKDIVRHYDITRKNCPAPWVKDEKQFIEFKNRVKAKLNKKTEEQLKENLNKEIINKNTTSKPNKKNDDIISKALSAKGIVAEIQSKLNNLYNAGLKVDNVFGKNTKKALIKAYQTELNKQFNAGLVVDGIWGNKTKAATRTIAKGAKGNITWILQATLYCLGYTAVGKIDGIFGSTTEKVVKHFQSKNKLKVDGQVGKQTWEALFK